MPPAPPPGDATGPPEPASNWVGVAALILGVVSIPMVCCLYLGIPLGIVAVVLGLIGKRRTDRGLATNRGQALTGLICGAIAAVAGTIRIVLGVTGTVEVDVPIV